MQERANIEKEFAKQLKSWSSKWNSLIEKGKTDKNKSTYQVPESGIITKMLTSGSCGQFLIFADG